MRYLSPLRYPGGKAKLAPYIAQVIARQRPRPRAYAEPFAGGAGAALRLLQEGLTEHAYINDLDPGISALWRCVFYDTDAFAGMVESAEVSIAAWKEHSTTYRNPAGKSDRELGFATFFLNRCNRSGILRARPIGGLEQSGEWKIDARYNRAALGGRVRHVGALRDSVSLSQLDAREFIGNLEHLGDDVLLYVDPPYLVQGDRLYLDSLNPEDHLELANQLHNTRLRWLLTYDADIRITGDLYPGFRCLEFGILHTAQIQRAAVEYAVFSGNLVVPRVSGVIGEGKFRWMTSQRKNSLGDRNRPVSGEASI